MFRLQERVALVTGASRGIGRATALRLAEQGAAVAVNYHSRAAAAHDVVEQVRHLGGRAVALQADVSSPAAVDEMLAKARHELGPVDILVNNAGLLFHGALLDYEKHEFEQMWEVNVKGILHVTAAAAPSMIERKYGRIINLSSIAALGTAFPGTTLYAATKAAVLTLTKRFALELGPAGITVNAVLPGLTVTDMVSGGLSAVEIERMKHNAASKSMLGRVGEPADIANVITFLASEESGFMTGQFLSVDGGRMDFLTHS
jgi:NAD(P)-dependent dehydrogenase (short-subunit alcohol dehydrogenase family)